MLTWQKTLPYGSADAVTAQYFREDSIFFDIETTGFSPASTSVYLIGCAIRSGEQLCICQFFAEAQREEAEILGAFLALLSQCKTVLTFNGATFDIPYLQAKCKKYGFAEPFSQLFCIDIYREIRPLKPLLGLPDYRQKSIERFLGIDREDAYDGGQLIEVYRAYIRQPSADALALLKQHNFEDVLYMPKLLPILSYAVLFAGQFAVTDIAAGYNAGLSGADDGSAIPAHGGRKELTFSLHFDTSVPRPSACSRGEFSLDVEGATAALTVRLFEGELKYFLDDWKNYEYLPAEDVAVPKELAAAIPAEHKKKATAATCYTRKNAICLPQYEQLFSPALRVSYRDKKSYFPLSDEFVASPELQKKYAAHVLHALLSAKQA